MAPPPSRLRLSLAYRTALGDVRDRPEWKRAIGAKEIRIIVARSILFEARNVLVPDEVLSVRAVGAVRAEYLRLREGSNLP
jgi:hypothetical protein